MLDYSAGPEGSTYECIATKMEVFSITENMVLMFG